MTPDRKTIHGFARYDALLLDMNGTFMFDQDRFGPTQDYHATYRALGGILLSAERLHLLVDQLHADLLVRYEDPQSFDHFPSVRDVLETLENAAALPDAELELLEAVIARHELGRVPDAFAEALRHLASSNRLGLLTNIWSRKDLWLEELRRVGVLELFEVALFSSDGPHIKPSPRLFLEALGAFDLPAEAVIYVGDSLRCDVGGARAAGMDSLWLNPDSAPLPLNAPEPTFIFRDLLAVAEATQPSRGFRFG